MGLCPCLKHHGRVQLELAPLHGICTGDAVCTDWLEHDSLADSLDIPHPLASDERLRVTSVSTDYRNGSVKNSRFHERLGFLLGRKAGHSPNTRPLQPLDLRRRFVAGVKNHHGRKVTLEDLTQPTLYRLRASLEARRTCTGTSFGESTGISNKPSDIYCETRCRLLLFQIVLKECADLIQVGLWLGSVRASVRGAWYDP
jgi:hypothetical protein